MQKIKIICDRCKKEMSCSKNNVSITNDCANYNNNTEDEYDFCDTCYEGFEKMVQDYINKT